MSEIFAFAGKGGVGKTTISGMLIRYLVEKQRKEAPYSPWMPTPTRT